MFAGSTLDLIPWYFHYMLQIFHLFDKSTPGSINFQEFVAVSASISKHKDFAKHVRSAFDACDLGKNGYMSHQEVSTSS
jgi:Ca2+-binding EF-hand superfamily protein